MVAKFLSVCSLVLVFALPGSASASELRLAIQNGRVSLSAHGVTLRQILLEWERVGGTRIVNRDRVPGTLLTLDLVDVPERQALETLLRSIAGFVAAKRLDPAASESQFSRIVLMPGSAALAPAATMAPPQASGPGYGMGGGLTGRPQVQRRVLPDGRVVTVLEDLQQAGDPDDPEDAPSPPGGAAGMTRPPFQGMPRLPQGQQADDGTPVDPQNPQAGPPGTKAAPAVPVTIAAPGALPTSRRPPTPPGPPKPPG